ncbi:thermonuclease family protein (plasmid) [Finegoldia magna]|uniref:thermonuclease family protein n=1 Tax=Finegoldia magna TaxID=1260 RepID=UPI00370D72CB
MKKNKRNERMLKLLACCLIAGSVFPINVLADNENPTKLEEKVEIKEQNDKDLKLKSVNLVKVKVLRVVDGDTFKCMIDGKEQTVRLIGVDTPESVNPNKEKNTVEGKIASEYTKRYLEDRDVELEYDIQKTDKYGRVLAYVWNGDTLFNFKLIRDGIAKPMTIAPNVKYSKIIRNLEKKAVENNKGFFNKDYKEKDILDKITAERTKEELLEKDSKTSETTLEYDFSTTKYNSDKSVEFKVYNKNNNEFLKDFVFTIKEKDSEEILKEEKSDENGNVKFTNLDPKKEYEISLKSVTDGYENKENKIAVQFPTISDTQEETNKGFEATLNVVIKDSDGKLIGHMTKSSPDGSDIVIDCNEPITLENGKYTIVKSTTPSGVTLDKEKNKINVSFEKDNNIIEIFLTVKEVINDNVKEDDKTTNNTKVNPRVTVEDTKKESQKHEKEVPGIYVKNEYKNKPIVINQGQKIKWDSIFGCNDNYSIIGGKFYNIDVNKVGKYKNISGEVYWKNNTTNVSGKTPINDFTVEIVAHDGTSPDVAKEKNKDADNSKKGNSPQTGEKSNKNLLISMFSVSFLSLLGYLYVEREKVKKLLKSLKVK